MSWIGRHAGLALAALLTLFLAIAQYRGGAGAIPTPLPVPIAAPPQPAAPVVKTKKKIRKKLAAKLVALSAAPPVAPAKMRGARLRDKGEALGGRTPDRVDTGTMTVRAAQ